MNPRTLDGAEIAGIGAALGKEGEEFVVKHILPDSPAAAHRGIGTGDRIRAVGHETEPAVQVKDLRLDEVVALIRGPKGSTVRLTIIPAGEDDSEAKDIVLVRGELKALARWGDGVRLAVGAKAPNIKMLNLAADKHEYLADYAGKIVVLEFWATWCGPCQKLVTDLQEYSARHPEWKDKVVVVALSIDEDASAAVDHLKNKGWDKTHNVWADADAVKAFHVNSLPTIYVIDATGNVAAVDPALGLEVTVTKLLAGQ